MNGDYLPETKTMLNVITICSGSLRHLPLAIRLADRFAMHYRRSLLLARWRGR